MDYLTQKSFENIDLIFDDACNKLNELKREFEPEEVKYEIDPYYRLFNDEAALRKGAPAQNSQMRSYGQQAFRPSAEYLQAVAMSCQNSPLSALGQSNYGGSGLYYRNPQQFGYLVSD